MRIHIWNFSCICCNYLSEFRSWWKSSTLWSSEIIESLPWFSSKSYPYKSIASKKCQKLCLFLISWLRNIGDGKCSISSCIPFTTITISFSLTLGYSISTVLRYARRNWTCYICCYILYYYTFVSIISQVKARAPWFFLAITVTLIDRVRSEIVSFALSCRWWHWSLIN